MTRTDDQLAIDREISLRLFGDDCGEAAATVRGDSVYRRLPEPWSTDRNLMPSIFGEIERRGLWEPLTSRIAADCRAHFGPEYILQWESMGYVMTLTPEAICRAAIEACKEQQP